MNFSEKTPFPKDPFFRTRKFQAIVGNCRQFRVILGDFWLGAKAHTPKKKKTTLIRTGRTWGIAVRRGSYKSLFLQNSVSELWFA